MSYPNFSNGAYFGGKQPQTKCEIRYSVENGGYKFAGQGFLVPDNSTIEVIGNIHIEML